MKNPNHGIRAILAGAAILLLFAGGAAATGSTKEDDRIRLWVEDVVQRATAIAELPQGSPEAQKQAELLLKGTFDVPRIARRMLEPRWKEVSLERQGLWTSAFQRLLAQKIVALAPLLKGASFEVLRTERQGSLRIVAEARLLTAHGLAFPMLWKLRIDDAGGLQVTDIAIPRNSMLSALRRESRRTMARKGLNAFLDSAQIVAWGTPL